MNFMSRTFDMLNSELGQVRQFLSELTAEEEDSELSGVRSGGSRVSDHEIVFINRLLENPTRAQRAFLEFPDRRIVLAGASWIALCRAVAEV